MRNSRLRAVNAVVSAAMLVLFLLHGVGNAFQLLGAGSPQSRAISYSLLVLCVVHIGIGVVLTLQTLRVQRQTPAHYPALNRRFWAVRVSGVALAVLIAFHAVVFWPSGDVVRLTPFAELELIAHVLLIAALAVHILANMEPLLVGLGLPAVRARAIDIAFVSALLLVFMLVAFVIYYLRWSVV